MRLFLTKINELPQINESNNIARNTNSGDLVSVDFMKNY